MGAEIARLLESVVEANGRQGLHAQRGEEPCEMGGKVRMPADAQGFQVQVFTVHDPMLSAEASVYKSIWADFLPPGAISGVTGGDTIFVISEHAVLAWGR